MKLRITITLLLLAITGSLLPAQEASKPSRDDLHEMYLNGGIPFSSSIQTDKEKVAPPKSKPGKGLAVGQDGDAQRVNACASGFIMNTPYNSNNGQRGCMFDITASSAVTIRCFESNVYAGTTANYEMYWRAGTHVGSENNAGAWTFLGGVTGVTSAGNNLPTALNIPVNVTIPAGGRYSFYITNDFGGGTSYTDGTAVGNFLAADANITIYEGVGKSYPFGLTFNVRNFNGHIFYDLGGALDASALALAAEASTEGVALNWEVATSEGIEGHAMERSLDGLEFEDIAWIDAASGPGQMIDRDVKPGTQYFYRMREVNKGGQSDWSPAVEVLFAGKEGFVIEDIFPNPFSDEININLVASESKQVQLLLYNSLGQLSFQSSQEISAGTNLTKISPAGLPAGVYHLTVSDGQTQLVRKLVRF